MVDATPLAAIDELSVDRLHGMQAASLRYFEPGGGFADQVHQIIGWELPGPLVAISAVIPGDRQSILAWRSPTETLLLATETAEFARLKERLAGAADGCMVDQTGGLGVLRLRGRRADDLVLRMGSNESIPRRGEARSSRLAELNVLTLCVQADELILVVERVYADHLIDWMSRTITDF